MTSKKPKTYRKGTGYIRKDGRVSRNVNVYLPDTDHAALKARAKAAGVAVATEARNIIQEAVR